MKSRAVSDSGFLRPQQANKGGSQALNRGLIMHTEQCCARLRHNRGSSEKQGPSLNSHRVKAAFGTGFEANTEEPNCRKLLKKRCAVSIKAPHRGSSRPAAYPLQTIHHTVTHSKLTSCQKSPKRLLQSCMFAQIGKIL